MSKPFDFNKFISANAPIICVVVVILIIVIYFIVYYNTSNYEDYLYGFWVAEGDAFCDDAEIDSLLLFIGEKKNNKRECYLVIMPDVVNQAFTMTHSSSMAGPGISDYKVSAGVEFEEDQIWPDNVDIKVDMRDGTIKIYSSDTMYVNAQKQHDTTNISRYLDD
jgi:hypothetical protein